MSSLQMSRRLLHRARDLCMPWTQIDPQKHLVSVFYPLSTMVDASQLLDTKKAGNALFHVDQKDTVHTALRMMRDRKTGSVLVTDKDMAIGIFTERDYMTKIAIRGRSSLTTAIGEVMTSNVHCVNSSASLDQCLAVLSHERFRHLPVVDGGVDYHEPGVLLAHVRGVFSVRDVIKELNLMLSATKHSIYADEVRAIGGQSIEDFISHEFTTVAPDQTVRSAVEKMADASAGRAIVYSANNEIIGIFTERDYLYKVLLENKDSKTTKVSDIMTTRAQTVVATPKSSVQWCLAQMVAKNCRQLPVLESNEGNVCIGIVSVGDVIGLHHST